MSEPSPTPVKKRRVLILSGMSGAGISGALKIFEDMGYESVDNLRLGLVPTLIEETSDDQQPLAIAIDTRNSSFNVDTMLEVVKQLSELPNLDVTLIFFECSDDVLQRRFTETRRRHPLAIDRPVTDGIKRERELLWRLRDAADHVVDTSLLSIHELKRLLAGQYRIDDAAGLTIFVTSFSYRHGVPREADLVFDARFLVNPHWDASLRPLTGKDQDVADYIHRDPDFAGFMQRIIDFVLPLLPRYQQEGKSYLTIAIGCTGGRHRSVLVTEELATALAAHDFVVGIGHRDLDRGGRG